MEETGRERFLIHLTRLDGSSLFLHPFTEHRNMVNIFSTDTPSGLFGREPQVERIRMFREHLYSIAEHDAKVQALDAGFVPRFLSAAATFLGLYLPFVSLSLGNMPSFFALLIPFTAAVVVYTAIALRYSRGPAALSTCTQLKRQIDDLHFDFSDTVVEIENALHELEKSTQEEILHFLRRRARDTGGAPRVAQAQTARSSSMSPLEADLISSLEKRLKDSGAFQLRRSVERWIRNGDAQSLEQVVTRLSRKHVDLPLFALYLRLTRLRSPKTQAV